MKKTLLSVIAVCAVLMSAQAADPKPLLILSVDTNEVLNGYYKAQEAQQEFQSSVDRAQAEVQSMYDEHKVLLEKFQKLQQEVAESEDVLTDKAREEKTKEAQKLVEQIRDKEQSINEQSQQYNRLLREQSQAEASKFYTEIQGVVSSVAQKRGADYVVNQAPAIVIYFNPDYDITQEVLSILNKNAPKKDAPKKDASKDDAKKDNKTAKKTK